MNFKTTIFLLVVFAVVAAGLFYAQFEGTQPTDTEDETNTDDAQYVISDRPDQNDIVRVQIERPGEPTLVFERDAGAADVPAAQPNWRIVDPLKAEAEGFQVRNVVTTLVGLQVRSSFTPGAEKQPTLAEAGLEPPKATVTLTDKADKAYVVQIGDKVVMSTDTYVKSGDADEVCIVERDLARPILDRELAEFRAKTLATLRPNDVTKLEITHDGQQYVLQRGADRQWRFTAPMTAQAEGEKVRGLISRISGLRVKEFVVDEADSLAPYGLDNPYLALTATIEQQVAAPTSTDPTETQPAEPQMVAVTETKRIAIGTFAGLKQEERYVHTGDARWVATVPAANVDGLVPDLKELRDAQVTRLPANQAQKIEITVGDETAALEKADGQWRGTGDLAELETSAVQDLLAAFSELSAIDYVAEPEDPATYGLASPRATIAVTSAAGDTVTVHVGAETASGRNAYVQRAGEASVSVVPAAQAQRLAIDLLALRSREVFKFDVSRLERIEVQRADRGYVLQKTDGAWTLEEPANVPMDAQHARQLANDLSRLRARQVVSNNLAAYGLNQPLAAIVFTLAPPAPADPNDAPAAEPTVFSLRVAYRDGQAYAAAGREPYVFEIDGTVYNVIVGEFIERRLFDFGADAVQKVAIQHYEDKLVLVRNEDTWQIEGDRFVALAQELVGQYMQRLANLRVRDYLAYHNGNLAAEGLDDPIATITITKADGETLTMPMVPEVLNTCPRKAAIAEWKRVFRLTDEDCSALLMRLEDFLAQK
jgi:hypothetical protein